MSRIVIPLVDYEVAVSVLCSVVDRAGSAFFGGKSDIHALILGSVHYALCKVEVEERVVAGHLELHQTVFVFDISHLTVIGNAVGLGVHFKEHALSPYCVKRCISLNVKRCYGCLGFGRSCPADEYVTCSYGNGIGYGKAALCRFCSRHTGNICLSILIVSYYKLLIEFFVHCNGDCMLCKLGRIVYGGCGNDYIAVKYGRNSSVIGNYCKFVSYGRICVSDRPCYACHRNL